MRLRASRPAGSSSRGTRRPASGAWRFSRRDVRLLALFAVAGAAPDLDLLAGAHSGPTHGLGAAALAGAVTFAVVAWRSARSSHPRGLSPPAGERGQTPAAGEWGQTPIAGGRGLTPGRLAAAVAAAFASHILLDWLGTDTSPPIGIMALWPFSHHYYESSAHVFMAISRRYWLPEFWTWNLVALGRELLILSPIAALIVTLRRRR